MSTLLSFLSDNSKLHEERFIWSFYCKSGKVSFICWHYRDLNEQEFIKIAVQQLKNNRSSDVWWHFDLYLLQVTLNESNLNLSMFLISWSEITAPFFSLYNIANLLSISRMLNLWKFLISWCEIWVQEDIFNCFQVWISRNGDTVYTHH